MDLGLETVSSLSSPSVLQAQQQPFQTLQPYMKPNTAMPYKVFSPILECRL